MDAMVKPWHDGLEMVCVRHRQCFRKKRQPLAAEAKENLPRFGHSDMQRRRRIPMPETRYGKSDVLA